MGKDLPKLWAVVKREYLERVRSKWFVIGTLVFPLLLAAMMFLPALLALRTRASSDVLRVAIIDATGAGLGERVAATLVADRRDTTTAASRPEVRVVAPAQLASAESLATQQVMRKALRGYLVLDSATLRGERARYAGRNASSIADVEVIRGAVRRAAMAFRLEQYGIPAARVDSLTRGRLALDIERISERGRGGSGAGSLLLGLIVAMLLYTAILLYGQNVMRGVMEEKQTRVAEVVVSSVRPEVLLAGKVLGVGAVGLTQMLVWIGGSMYVSTFFAPFLRRLARDGGSAGLSASAGAASGALSLPEIGLGVPLALLLFFVLGYIFYSSLFAAVGAMVNSEQEAQQVAAPVFTLVILSVIFLQPILMNPSGRLAQVMSWLPFSAPIIMPLRMSLVTVSPLEVVLSLAGVALACVLAIWVAARIYRVGLLMYGKRPTLAELARWVRRAA